MTQTNQTTAAHLTERATLNLLSALKAGAENVDAKSDAFASLFSEIKASLSELKHNAPKEAVREERSVYLPEAERKTAVQNGKAPVQNENQEDGALAQTPLKKEEKTAAKTETSSEQREAEEPKAKEAKTSESENTETAEDASETAVLAVHKNKSTEDEEQEDGLALLALLATLGPLDGATQKDAKDANKTEEGIETAEKEEIQAILIPETAAAPSSPTGDKTEKIESLDELQAKLESATNGKTVAPVSVGETKTEIPVEQTALSKSSAILKVEEKAENVAVAMPQIKQAEQKNTAQALSEQDTTSNKESETPQKQGENRASSVANAQNAIVAPEARGQTMSPSATSGAATTLSAASEASSPTAVTAGARAFGTYDFAGQLSLARTSKGTTSGPTHTVEQIAVQIRKMVNEGRESMTIRLKPAELGKIEVRLEFSEGGKVRGFVVADNQNTLSLLVKESDGLQKALADAGLQADSGSLQFSLRDEGQSGRLAQERTGDAFGQTGSSDDVQENESALVVNAALETYYVTPERVNLRV